MKWNMLIWSKLSEGQMFNTLGMGFILQLGIAIVFIISGVVTLLRIPGKHLKY